MSNFAGAVQTLGEGLFKVGAVVTRREEDEIAFMRQKALQELGLKGQKELQQSNQEFLSKQQTTEFEHADVSQGRTMAFESGRQAQAQEFQIGLAKNDQDFRLRLQNSDHAFSRDLQTVKSIEEAQQRTDYQLTAISKDIQDLRVEREKAAASGADDSSLARFDSWIESLMSQQDTVRAVGIATQRRLSGEKPISYPGADKGSSGDAAPPPAAAKPAPKPGGPPAGAYTGGGPAADPGYRAVPQGIPANGLPDWRLGQSYGPGPHSAPGASDQNQDLFAKRPAAMYPGR